MKTYVLDSFAMIAFFEDEPGADRVAEILSAIGRKRARGFMSVINWGEIYYNTIREAGMEEAEKVMKQFNKHSIQLVDADQDLTYRAAKLKATYPVAYADCFAAALSSKLKATVVTGDPEFEKLSREVTICWIT
ncbi:MAG: type II toxin-antitoxin system VapC family toxin [Deltaproteobacteria bacterium]|nr:type II toxin-antitoxin system VapC family toxin [Deltaproteobacteria bacterium]